MAYVGGILLVFSYFGPMVLMVFVNEKRFEHFKKRLEKLERKTA